MNTVDSSPDYERAIHVTKPGCITFPDTLRLKVPRGLQLAIRQAAGKRHTTPAEWARQVLLRGLEAEGVRLCDGKPERAA